MPLPPLPFSMPPAIMFWSTDASSRIVDMLH